MKVKQVFARIIIYISIYIVTVQARWYLVVVRGYIGHVSGYIAVALQH